MLGLHHIPCSSFPAAAAAKSSSYNSGSRNKSSRIRISCSSGAATMDSPVRLACSPTQSLYDVLGVSQQSELKDIKSAYRHLARVTHPDVAAMENKEESTKEFLRIHAAYTTLSDPESRARYDLQLSLQSLPRFSPRGGFSGFGYDSYSYAAPSTAKSPSSPWKTSKSWETDQCW